MLQITWPTGRRVAAVERRLTGQGASPLSAGDRCEDEETR
jgi:hypothetical protein